MTEAIPITDRPGETQRLVSGAPMFVVEIIEDRSTSLETCDRCGTGVYAACRVILGNGAVLTFCAHHSHAYGFGDVWHREESKLQGNEN